MTAASEFLNKPIASLPLSNELKELLSLKGYASLSEILKQKVSHLRMKDGLDLNQELQLFDLITKNGFGNLWKEE